VVEAEIQTAFDLEPAQLSDLTARLEKHTGRKVRVSVNIDKELIGGVRVLFGDQVIDASVRAQLAALQSALKA
jgi:F-type H+-transporting ATPase subunit delta